jgi:site-specific DNA recombinase
MQDIEAGKIDCVVVYKVDRLSRSLLDFARLMEFFDKYHVSFIAVTQPINTGDSAGRLMLNVLLSFAQFEREIIAERTRDKIAAIRRKGKWSGGRPLLGYDIDPRGSRLVVNEDEAIRVQAIFGLYLEHQSLLPVVEELERRGWTGKRWQTRQGRDCGGRSFTRTSLHRLLTNVTYAGKVRYKSEIHAGEHTALVDQDVWERTQALLHMNGATAGAAVRNQFGALLKGLLHCVPCGCAMTPSHTTRNGNKRYRYYLCSSAQKRGHKTCPAPSIPAAEIERVVVGRIRLIGKDAALQKEVFAEVVRQDKARLVELEAEKREVEKDLARCRDRNPIGQDISERVQHAEQTLARVREELHVLRSHQIHEDDVWTALGQFDNCWEVLTPPEQARLVQLLVDRVEYDGADGNLSITLRPTGIRTLVNELAADPGNVRKEKRA